MLEKYLTYKSSLISKDTDRYVGYVSEEREEVENQERLTKGGMFCLFPGDYESDKEWAKIRERYEILIN